MERRIGIAGLRCDGRHGAYVGERDVTRAFFVDIRAVGALIDDDVETIASVARSVVAERSHALLERVADSVADAILAAIDRVSSVEVRVAKPDPPGLDAASEAVALIRVRRNGSRAPSAPHARLAQHRERE